jgi:hypothetical protein
MAELVAEGMDKMVIQLCAPSLYRLEGVVAVRLEHPVLEELGATVIGDAVVVVVVVGLLEGLEVEAAMASL